MKLIIGEHMSYANQFELYQTLPSLFETYQPIEKHHPYDEDILDALKKIVEVTLRFHHRVRFLRCDLNYPAFYPPLDECFLEPDPRNGNETISKFNEALKHRITTMAVNIEKPTILSYLWVREKSHEGNVHYHVLLGVNADTFPYGLGDINDSKSLAHKIQLSWNSAIKEPKQPPYYVHFGNQHYVNRNHQPDRTIEELTDTLNHVCYLAKKETKENIQGLRNFGTSQFDSLGLLLNMQAKEIEMRKAPSNNHNWRFWKSASTSS